MTRPVSEPEHPWSPVNPSKHEMVRIRLAVLATIVAAALVACGGTSAASTATLVASPPPETAAADWGAGARMPTARSEMPAVVVGDRIYVPGGFGGLSKLEWYDPAADEWGAGPDLPGPRHHLMAAAYADTLYVFGGAEGLSWRPTDNVWAYDMVQRSWQVLGSMPETRLAGAAAAVGDRIYLAGGVGGGEDLLVYAPESDSWRRVAGPSVRREHVAAIAFGGEFWLLGGRWRGEGERRSTEVYSVDQGGWRSGPDLLEARAGFAAASGDGRIMAAGGELLGGERRVIGSVEAWSSDEGAWRAVSALPDAVHGLGAAYLDGRWYFIGGSDRAGGIENAGRVQILSQR